MPIGVTKPWFDYVMGTRGVFGRFKEQNPLGIRLPTALARPLSQAVEKSFQQNGSRKRTA